MNMSDSRTVGRSDRVRERGQVLAALVLAFLSVSPTVRLSAQLSPQDSAFHALNRPADGPRPGDVPRVAAGGVLRWIDRQLSPDGINDDRLAQQERQFAILAYDRGDLAAMYTEVRRERRERKRAAGETAEGSDSVRAQHAAPLPKQTPLPTPADPMIPKSRRLAGEFADLAVVRAALAERQLYEVMVDFWTNHFNVYFAKGADRFLTPDYIEHTIRPRAMGKFEGGRDMDEGIRLLKLLANHPATMHHVSRKLCQRFVNDDPPDGCVDDAVATWQRSSGDIREVLRAIFHGPDFWAVQNVRAKVKTPLEFVVSAARAVAAEPDTSPRLAQVVARLGEPLYLHVAPDGYPEREAAWVNSGALLDRMNAAVALAAGKLQGVTVVLDSLVATGDADQLISVVNEKILGGTMSENTKQVLRRQLAGIGDPMQARALAVGLTIGGPEFQRQ